ncbi:MAG: hypothetical protein ACI85O_001518 [Saprospiraceae bacterium]|jgi:hypothetical protein
MIKKVYKAIGYWHSRKRPQLPDPTWFFPTSYEKEEKAQMISYLDSAEVVDGSRNIVSCSLCDDFHQGEIYLTDGEYIFPKLLKHYVEAHNVKLPTLFLDKITSKQNEPLKNEANTKELGPYISRRTDYTIDFNWWVTQKGEYLLSEEGNEKLVSYYDNGTKRIDTPHEIFMYFTNGDTKRYPPPKW